MKILWILFPGCKFKCTIYSGLKQTLYTENKRIKYQNTGKAKHNLAQGRMDIKVEFAFDVVRGKLTEMGFVPNNFVTFTDLIESGG